MNRQIKFRAKRLDNGKWVYGDLTTQEVSPRFCGDHCIFDGDWHVVDPATIGQYTGLTDVNGTEIYEGDILGDVKFPKATPLICEFRHGAFGYEYCGDFHPWGGNTNFTFNPFNKDSRFEIIGNIHDI